MIDLHCHLLPGIDDGPADLAGALDQARAHVDAGVRTVVCTPHVSHGYANTSEGISDAVEALQRALDAEAVPLQLRTGAEVSLSRALELDDDELARLHLGGGGWLLLEPPLATDAPRLAQMVGGIQSRGHRVLIAHPERCASFHHDANLLGEMVRSGAVAQVTAGSLTGAFGRTVQKLARGMVDAGLVAVVASDAHDSSRRVPGLAQPLSQVGLETLSDWACEAVPESILDGTALPERPAGLSTGHRHRGRLFRRR